MRFAEHHVYAGDASVFGVGYDRFTWHNARTELTVDVGPGLQHDSILGVLISKRFLRKKQIISVVPQPLLRADSGAFVVYGFLRRDRRRAAHIVFQMRSRSHGAQRGVVALAGVTALPVRQLVLP